MNNSLNESEKCLGEVKKETGVAVDYWNDFAALMPALEVYPLDCFHSRRSPCPTEEKERLKLAHEESFRSAARSFRTYKEYIAQHTGEAVDKYLILGNAAQLQELSLGMKELLSRFENFTTFDHRSFNTLAHKAATLIYGRATTRERFARNILALEQSEKRWKIQGMLELTDEVLASLPKEFRNPTDTNPC